MDYYTYQKQFAENLNNLINQQHTPNSSNELIINYPCTVSQNIHPASNTSNEPTYPLTIPQNLQYPTSNSINEPNYPPKISQNLQYPTSNIINEPTYPPIIPQNMYYPTFNAITEPANPCIISKNMQYPTNVNEATNYPCTVSKNMQCIPTTIEPTNPLNMVSEMSYPSYNTHATPIPPQVYDLSLSSTPGATDVKTDDELWIETWLAKIGKIQINLNSTIEVSFVPEPKTQVKSSLQIHTAKASFKHCFRVLDQLQQMQEYIKDNVAKLSTIEWNSKTMEIGIVKEHFSKLISQFERPEVVTHLRLIVEKRRKKRNAQKRRKQNRKNNFTEMLENRQKLHKDIDCWLESMKEEVERAKIEENIKKEADSVLAEVTKKKSDARKLLSLISSLVKLRYVREQTAIQRGDKISLEDSIAFTKATERLDKIWNDNLNVYTKEEQGLRMMLEETAAEDNNAARIARERKITHEWDCTLFGPKRMPSPAYWGLMVAEKDLETFIAIRKSWDTFLTDSNDENGSSIPIGWVMPNSNPEQNWAKYLDAF